MEKQMNNKHKIQDEGVPLYEEHIGAFWLFLGILFLLSKVVSIQAFTVSCFFRSYG